MEKLRIPVDKKYISLTSIILSGDNKIMVELWYCSITVMDGIDTQFWAKVCCPQCASCVKNGHRCIPGTTNSL